MAADMAATGEKYYTLAFLVSAVRLHSRLGGRRLQPGHLQLADQRHSGGRRQRHHLVRRRGCHRARADLHERLAAHRRLPEHGEHLPLHPAGLRHRGLRPGRHRRHVPARPGARRAASAGPGRAGRLHPRRRPERAAHRQRLGVRGAPGRQGQGREGVGRQHHDDGLRRRVQQRPRGRRVGRPGDRRPAVEPVRDLDLGRLRHDGPDAHRRHQRRRHRLLHLERPVAGELRRLQRRRRSCPSGRSTATTRGPATSTRRSSTRSPAAGAALLRPPGAPGRSPGTRACAWTTARPAPPTSTRSRSTPATGPTRRAGP